MNSVQVRITGLRETVRALESFGVATDDLREAFGSIARRVIALADPLTPVDTGTLKGSIRPARTKNKAVVRAGSAAIPWAPVQHWGGRGIIGRLFLKRPADDHQQEHITDMEKNLRALIVRYRLA